MREWEINTDDLPSLRIAADARFCTPRYLEDQTWELKFAGGDPAALSIETTYGLRARLMRIFPGFWLHEKSVTDPKEFYRPPVLRSMLPNYVKLDFEPFLELRVIGEYWVPESHLLTGRMTFLNQSSNDLDLQWLLYAVLRSLAPPLGMRGMVAQGVHLLAGQSGNVSSVLFLVGGAKVTAAPYPALVSELSLAPGEARNIQWIHAGLGENTASFQAARQVAERNWDAEMALLELENQGLVEIETGDPAWDLAFCLAQKSALSSFVGPTAFLPNASPVAARRPDTGYSQQGDGRDYGQSWEGQSIELTYLALTSMVMTAPELAKGAIRNYLHAQQADGEIDGKPGLAGQRSGLQCSPLLSYLTWLIYQHTGDRKFLQETYSRLLQFLDSWFLRSHDRDGDGFPEWDHTLHAGFDDWPTFVRWHRWGQGLDLSKAETPDLAAYLYRDLLALSAVATELGIEEDALRLGEQAGRLRAAVQDTWTEGSRAYHHRDRDLNLTMSGESLGSGSGSYALELGKEFDPPVRILVRSVGEEGASHAIKVFLHGKGRTHRNRIERLTEYRFQWFWDFGTATSEKTYTALDRIEISGVEEAFETEVRSADYSMLDLTCLLPLWAEIPGQSRADKLIRRVLLKTTGFWRSGGVPAVPASDPSYASSTKETSAGIRMLWNAMLGEGLLSYGYLQEAVTLVSKLMQTTLQNLKKDGGWRSAYHADTGEGYGERDHLGGIAPLALFLQTLGLRLHSPHRVALRGTNPYPWPITIRWRGLEFHWEAQGAKVTFPNGQEVELAGEAVQEIEMVLPGEAQPTE